MLQAINSKLIWSSFLIINQERLIIILFHFQLSFKLLELLLLLMNAILQQGHRISIKQADKSSQNELETIISLTYWSYL